MSKRYSRNPVTAAAALWLLILQPASASAPPARPGRFLFNVVQFKNDVCSLPNSNFSQGVCFTRDECLSKGGWPTTPCAAGFGTCCVFRASCHGELTSSLGYFSNMNYPETDHLPNFCGFSIKVKDPDVCQVRLDFLDFKLSGPSLSMAPFGSCSHDRMAIFGRQFLGLSDGNLLCGDMTGQHIYIPVSTSGGGGEDRIQLFAMVGTGYILNGQQNASYSWNIKIRLIDCKVNDPLMAPPGCLQYFSENSGSITSFNFGAMDRSPYPVNLNYAICIKKQEGACRFSLSTKSAGDAFKMNTNGADGTPAFGQYCYDYTGSGDSRISNDFIALLAAATSQGPLSVPAAHFCGIFDGVSTTFPEITSRSSMPGTFLGPIMIHVKTDEWLKGRGLAGPAQSPANALDIVNNGGENGFKLTYYFYKDQCHSPSP